MIDKTNYTVSELEVAQANTMADRFESLSLLSCGIHTDIIRLYNVIYGSIDVVHDKEEKVTCFDDTVRHLENELADTRDILCELIVKLGIN